MGRSGDSRRMRERSIDRDKLEGDKLEGDKLDNPVPASAWHRFCRQLRFFHWRP